MLLLLVADALAAKPVPLEFAWPVGGRASVTQTTVDHTEVLGKEPRHVEYVVRHDVTVAQAPEGLGVTYALRDGSLVSVPQAERPLFEAQLAMAAGDFFYLLSPEGSLLRLDGIEQAAQRARAPVEAFLAAQPEEMQRVAKPILDALTPEILATNAATQWWVPAWTGQSMKPGKVVSEATTAQSGLGPEVPATASRELVERAPCHDADAETRCVRLKLTLAPEPKALSEALRGMFPDVESMNPALLTVSTVDLLVEPETLRPWRIESALEMSLSIDAPTQGSVVVRHQLKSTTSEWTWE